jgi:hypothetical protein
MRKKSAWIILAAMLLVTLPARLSQILFFMDRETGFYSDQGVLTAVVSVGLAVGALAVAILCYTDRSKPKCYSVIRSISTAVFGILAGLGLVVESVFGLMDGNSGQIHTMYMILSLVGILTGIVFMLTAYDFSVGENRFAKYPALALVPPIWGCAALVALFITYVAVANVAENIYNTFTVIFLLLFLFAQAKLLAGVESQNSSRLVYVFGLPAILFSLVTGISGVVSYFIGARQIGYFPVGLHFVNVLLTLYIFVFLLAVRKLPDEELPADEEQEIQNTETGSEPPEMRLEEASESEKCRELLAREYKSAEQFLERTPSPYQK